MDDRELLEKLNINDTFYSVWQHVENIDLEKGSLQAYLTTVARNKAKNKLRECKESMIPLQETDYIETGDFYEELEQKERAQVLKEVLNTLKTEEREILIRYYFMYETTEEIAVAMKMRRNTVKSELSRGRKKLEIVLRERGICQ